MNPVQKPKHNFCAEIKSDRCPFDFGNPETWENGTLFDSGSPVLEFLNILVWCRTCWWSLHLQRWCTCSGNIRVMINYAHPDFPRIRWFCSLCSLPFLTIWRDAGLAQDHNTPTSITACNDTTIALRINGQAQFSDRFCTILIWILGLQGFAYDMTTGWASGEASSRLPGHVLDISACFPTKGDRFIIGSCQYSLFCPIISCFHVLLSISVSNLRAHL